MRERETPTLEVELRDAASTASSFHYDIQTRPQDQFSQPLRRGVSLPSRLVIARRLLGPDGKPREHFEGAPPWLPMTVGGGTGGNIDGPIKTLRFVVAVDPRHRQIPFEFQHIPLPDPNQPPARHQRSQ